jgi:hypothetical protein
MNVQVECYSGAKADERPIRFQLDGREYAMQEVLDHWYLPEDTYFKLRATIATSTYSATTRLRTRGRWNHFAGSRSGQMPSYYLSRSRCQQQEPQ